MTRKKWAEKKKAPAVKSESLSKSLVLRPISKSTEFGELVKEIQKNDRELGTKSD